MPKEASDAQGFPEGGVPTFQEIWRTAEIDSYDPTALKQLAAARKVLAEHLKSVDAEALAAAQRVYDTRAAETATLQSHVYALTAEAHRAGFTIADLNGVGA